MSSEEVDDVLNGVAIIGMACRFPGAHTIGDLWRNLCDGVESVSFFTDEELLASGIDPAVLRNPNYIKARGVLDGIDLFDAALFGYTPREAEILDPQQRLFLECAWEALEHAGYNPDSYEGSIGVYAGASTSSYIPNLEANREIVELLGAFQAMISNDKDYLTTRVSYKLNLQGPSVTVQTACSTSLVAVHHACQSISTYQCDIALAGGVSITIPHRAGYVYHEGGITSPDGHCRAFDARSQGFVGGNGVGIVVLKRLADALDDGDYIYAVIKGSAVNNDGSVKVGYTAPSEEGQAAVIAMAQAIADVDPASISYIEAHGTGTALGDPIEIAALTQVFGDAAAQPGSCAIGSLKTNMGHLDTASGVAGLIKTALALEHKYLPPSLHFEQPNPKINWENSPFYVNTTLKPWIADGLPRRAGVSSFGIGGTNAHVVLEEAPPRTPTSVSQAPQLLVLSANTATALDTMTENLSAYLMQNPTLNLADVVYTLQVGRKALKHRRILVSDGVEDAAAALSNLNSKRIATAAQDLKDRPVLFLFPGQGTQYVGMAADLYEHEPFFREQIDECSAVLEPLLGLDLRTILFPDPEDAEAAAEQLNQTWLTQPALFTIEYALAQLWMAWGVQPEGMIGHSIGEYVAACLAGVFSLQDALTLVAARGKLLQTLPAGAMLAVPLPEHEICAQLDPRLSLAAVNGPSRCVVAGPVAAVEQLQTHLAGQGIDTQRLQTSHAFHSAMVEPILGAFTEHVRRIRLNPPRIPYISNVTGTWATATDVTTPQYWAAQLRQTVRFANGLNECVGMPTHVLLEVGPGRTLGAFARFHPQKHPDQVVLASLRRAHEDQSDVAHLLTTLGHLWLHGVAVKWSALSRQQPPYRIPLPSYPFERKRYWLDARSDKRSPSDHAVPVSNMPTSVSQRPQSESKPPRQEIAMPTPPAPTHLPSRRYQQILASLSTMITRFTGVPGDQIDIHTTLLEAGFDSLLLIQLHRALLDEFDIKLTLIQLLEEHSSLERLAAYIDQELPPVAPDLEPSHENHHQTSGSPAAPLHMEQPATPSHPAPANDGHPAVMGAAPAPGAHGLMGQIIQQQLQLMSQQLEVFRSMGAEQAGAVLGSMSLAQPTNGTAPGLAIQPTNGTAPGLAIQPTNGTASLQPEQHAALPTTDRTGLRVESAPFVAYRPIDLGTTGGLTAQQKAYLDDFIHRYTERTSESKRLTQQYRAALADSRTTAIFRPLWKEMVYTIIGHRSSGSKMWDVDGNEYVDIAMGFGVHLFGHSPDFVTSALEQQLKDGVQLGPQSHLAGQVAELFCEISGTERVSFCNSGTEAIIAALRIARTVTRRNKIAYFSGAYHGWSDFTLGRSVIADGQIESLPIAPGVPPHAVADAIVLDYDRPESLDILKAHMHELAAVLVEPIQSRRPDRQPTAFLHELRRLTAQSGTALIFDEMITGFRAEPTGAQGWFGIQADLVTYGKVFGGGLPVGAVAGKAAWMNAIDGGMWHYGDSSYPAAEKTLFVGTFFKHPLTMAATWATLQHLQTQGPRLQADLNERTAQFADRLNRLFEDEQVPIQVVHFSSLFRFNIPRQARFLELFFYHLTYKGIYNWEGGNCFLSTAHTDADLDRIVQAIQETIAELRLGGFLPSLPPTTPHEPQRGESQSQDSHARHSTVAPVTSTPVATNLPDLEISFPLTEPQKGVWIQSQLGGDTGALYNESITLYLHGPLQAATLRAAFQTVVDRHESLRTVFSPDGTHQQVKPALKLDIPLVDFSMLDEASRAERVNEFIRAETLYAFDLVHGPLLRVCLVKLEAEYHLLVFTLHHLVTDGQSVGVVLREVIAFYTATRQGVSAELPPPVQFRDYVAWMERQQQSRAVSDAEEYWLTQFQGTVPVLDLPTDRARPPVQTYAGAQYIASVDASLFHALRQISSQSGSTLFMTMLSGFNILLHRLSGQQDVVVGVPSAGQHLMGAPSLTGYCINLLPIRSSLPDNLAWRTYLSTIKRVLLEAQAYQNYSLGKLISKLQIPRDPSRSPLVSVIISMENSGSGLKMFDLDIDVLPNPKRLARFDIALNIAQIGDELRFEWDYNTDLFDLATIQRWMSYYHTLLEAIVAQPEQPIAALPLQTSAEREQVLVTWNSTAVAYPQSDSLHQLIETQVAATPDAVALIVEDTHLTYRELNSKANQLAHYLRQRGVGPETLVGICAERSVELVVGLLGILKAGGAYVPLDPSYPQARLAFMLEDAQVALLLTQHHLRGQLLESQVPVFSLDDDWPQIAAQSTTNPSNEITPDNLAYMIYTSGSTGRPKGAMNTHGAIINRLLWMQDTYQLNSSDRVLQKTPFSFDVSVWEFFWPLLTGATLVMARPGGHQDPVYLAEVIVERQITTLHFVPPMLQVFLDEPKIAHCTTLRRVICSGEALPFDLQERCFERLPDVELHNLYGPTEAAVDVTWWACQPESGLQTVPIGYPIANTQIYLLDRQFQPVPVGVPGELYIGGVQLARGYAKRPALTAEKFIPDPFSGLAGNPPGQRLYRTGDLARWLPNGAIEYLARIDHQVKIRGFRIELGEIEATLRRHPVIHDVAVLARQDNPGEQRLVAYVVAQPAEKHEVTPDSVVDAATLRAFLQHMVPSYMVPSAFVFLDALPLTPNGKLDRRALPAPSRQSTATAPFVAPRTVIEQQLADIWTQVLNFERIGVHDNFFQLGGDSIQGIRIIARANSLGLQLTPRQIFQHQTLAELAAVAETSQRVLREQGPVTGAAALTPTQHWFFEQHSGHLHHYNQAILLEVHQTLDPALLERSLQCLVVHHDALRLRCQHQDSAWNLTFLDPDMTPSFEVVDLAALATADQSAAITATATQTQQQLNISDGPLLRVVLFELGAHRSNQLFIVIHHLAVDGVSWRILLEDLWTVYDQLRQGQEPVLPLKTTTLKHWTDQLTSYAESDQARSELAYWLANVPTVVTPLPLDHPEGANTEAHARTLRITLDKEETQALLKQVPHAYRTQINDVLLTALAQAMTGWTGARSLLVDVEGHGREDIFADVDLSRTVGWFTSIFPIHLGLEEQGHPGVALKAIKEQLRHIPNRGIGYGVLRYLSRADAIREQLRTRPQAEVLFNYLGQIDHAIAQSLPFSLALESVGPSSSPDMRRPYVIEINGLVIDGQLQVEWRYSADLHHQTTVEAVAQSFLSALRSLIVHCISVEAGSYTPSDFPLARLSQPQLDALVKDRHGIVNIYPLSPMQQGMLFHSVYTHTSYVYVGQMHAVLPGDLDINAFSAAWQQVADQHAVLRTSFHWTDLDAPVQMVHQHVTVPLQYLDWSDLSPDQQHAQIATYLVEDRERGFDLGSAPLIRLILIKMGPERHYLIWTQHHLILDGWSAPMVLNQALACYMARRNGQPLELEPSQDYSKYIAWLQRQDMAQAEQFWRKMLDGFSAPTPLGVDRPASYSNSVSATYEEYTFRLSKATTNTLKQLAQQSHLTMSTVIQGVWALLLSRYSGQDEVVFGVTVSGRPTELPGVETIVGLFINTLPMRVRVQRTAGLIAWLQQLQALQVELRQYDYSPLVDVQGWSSVPRGQPLFESIVLFENQPREVAVSDEADGPVMEFRGIVEQTSFPLTLLAAAGSELFIQLSYGSHRFDAATILRMAEHLETLLTGIAADPSARLADLPILTTTEQQQLAAWNSTTVVFPHAASVQTLFEARVAQHPDAVAVIYEDQRITYAELNMRANQLAYTLRARGVGPEVRVALYVERSLDMVIGLLGTLKAGGTYIPLDPMYPQERVAFMLADAQVAVVLTQTALVEYLPPHQAQLICLDGADVSMSSTDAPNPSAGVLPDSLAYIIYTSGSTGTPKGVQIPHGALTNFLLSMQQQLEIAERDVLLAVTTVSFDIAGLELYLPLIAGARVVIASRSAAMNGALLAQVIQDVGATMLQATPATWQALLTFGWAGAPGLTALCGGEALPPELAAKIVSRTAGLWNMYGPTETTIWSSCGRVLPTTAPIVVGRPIANTEIYLLDTYLQPVLPGIPGELYIGGAGVARGYLNRPDLTAERFIPDPFSARLGGRLYRTGDLARYLADGTIEHLGRLDQQVKVRGFRIELGEIETVLSQHRAVETSAVLLREDTPGDHRLVAYVVPRPNGEGLEIPGTGGEIERVEHWHQAWNDIYFQGLSNDPTFNLAGWNSSYTHKPIPAEEMAEWLDHTVARILALQPRHVLEIGCGTGLLLFRIAPHCVHYTGTDFSSVVVEMVKQQVAAQELTQRVTVQQQEAAELTGMEPSSFDVVILNSVIQYFPSIEYLLRTLETALTLVRPGGAIFIGDVRNLALLPAFHALQTLLQAPDTLAIEQVRQHVQRRVSQEKELVLDPQLFQALRHGFPRISDVQIQLKRGYADNELTQFRYDVLLRVEQPVAEAKAVTSLNWAEGKLTINQVRRLLEETAPTQLLITQVPNQRVAPALALRTLLNSPDAPATAGELKGMADEILKNEATSGVAPELWWEAGADVPYEVSISWSQAAGSGYYDVRFRHRDAELTTAALSSVSLKPWQEYANQPLAGQWLHMLEPQLRQFLQARLPAYMLPGAFVALTAFPLTPNGKVDRKALPAPDMTRPALETEYIAPQTPLEQTLAEIWEQVLHLERVGVQDNFFRLGGHSLLAMQIISRVRDMFKIAISFDTLFASPNIAAMARLIEQQTGQEQEQAIKNVSRSAEEDLLANLDQLPDQDIDALLADMLSSVSNDDLLLLE